MRAVLPKKKRKGPTGDTISLSSTETIASTRSDEPTTTLGLMLTSAEEQTDTEESADAELGTPLLISMVLIKAGTHESLLDHLKKDWNTSIYAFFQPIPNVDHDNG